VERFIRRVVDAEKVWYLSSKNGVAYCDSNGKEAAGGPAAVLLFFSDEAYAQRAHKSHFWDYEVSSISLFDFLYRWLPGMSADGVLAGSNWTGDLIGSEVEAFPLRERIECIMNGDHLERYRKQYEDLAGA
jgi:hypothetical protein